MNDPVVIGASGGSGTRVFAQACIGAGVQLGARLNRSLDAMDFVAFLDAWIDPTLRGERFDSGAMRDAFDEALGRHRAPLDPARDWGWKNPRSMLILPWLHRTLPGLRFLHVVRDGRDMACSGNQNQLRKHGAALLGAELADAPVPVRSMAFWARSNLAVARYGATMGERYLALRFEDLCRFPDLTLRRLAAFLDRPAAGALAVRDEIAPPESIGRWRELEPGLAGALLDVGQRALAYFGYLETGNTP